MISYAEIKAEILANLDMDNDSEAATKFDVLNKANAAQRTLLRKVPVTEVDNILKSVTGNLSANVAYYQWPSDFIRVSDLFVDFNTSISDTNQGVEAVFSESGIFQVRSLDQQAHEQYPLFFYVDGGFELRPIPSSDVTDGWMLRYIYEIPDMSDTQDSLLRSDLKNLLIYKATSLCALVNQYSLELHDKYEMMFIKELNGLWEDNKA